MKKALFILAAAALLAVGCNKEMSTSVPSKGGPVRFATTLNTYTVKSSSLSENDQLGVFAGAPITRINVLGTVTSSKGVAFEPGSEICWKEGQTGKQTFAAYYPYSASCDATAGDPLKFTFNLAADQSTAEGVAAADLLTAVAKDVAVPADPATAEPVALNFIHQGAKLVVNVTKEISAAVMKVEILGTKLAGTVDLETQTVATSGDAGVITAYRPNSGANTFEAILLPAANIAPQIKVTVAGGTTYTYSMTGTLTFEAGKQYTATLNIAALTSSPSAATFSVGAVADWNIIPTPVTYDATPVVVNGNSWGIVGLGGDWDNDLPMEEVSGEAYCWTITIDYTAGDEFKFRYAKSWDVQYGGYESPTTIDQTWIDATTDSNRTYGMKSSDNGNFKLPAAGNYTLKIYTGGDKAGDLYVTKN